jgi:hypothetical protein
MLIVFCASSLAACDPGYEMTPVGTQQPGSREWLVKYDDFELEAQKISGLAGEYWLDPTISITTGAKAVLVESVYLQTPTGNYPADVRNLPRVFPAFSHRKVIYAYWDFPNRTPAPSMMGKSSEIVLHVVVGGKDETARIEYRPTEGSGA